MPIIDRLILDSGKPISVESIYKALPSETRDELDRGSTNYSSTHRIRRMLRRNRKYVLSAEGVLFADPPQKDRDIPEGGVATRVIRRDDGGIAALEIQFNDTTIYATPAEVRAALRAGRTIEIRIDPQRPSTLRLSSGKLYSATSDGSENDDFQDLPSEDASNIPSLALEDSREIGDQ